MLLAAAAFGAGPAAAASPWQNLANPIFVRADTSALPEAAVMAIAQDSAATGHTNPALLARLENGFEDLLRSGVLEVVSRGTMAGA